MASSLRPLTAYNQIVEIRGECATDQKPIRVLHEASFPTSVEADIVDALRNAEHLSLSLVCCDQDLVIGHVAFSPVTVNGSSAGLGLGPVAVAAQYRRQGIAEKLIRAGLDKSKALGFEFVVVLGDPAYYRRFGFEAASTWDLVDEYGGGNAFQAVELCDGGIPTAARTVKYGPEFAIAE